MFVRKLIGAALGLAFLLSARPARAAKSDQKSAGDAVAPGRTLSDKMEGLKFRCIGPFRGGRSVAVAGVRGEPLNFYFGGAGGGVWKTTDGGAHWEPTSDKDFKTGSVGAIAVSDSDHNVVYAGMGESPIRGNLSSGDGVYRSTDGAKSWSNAGLKDTHQISRIRIHPTNPDVVYVAALGHAWAPNPERGIFRSQDGGRTWKKILFVDAQTGAADLSMDPNNPRILYASFWQVVRKPWSLENGGSGSGIYRTTDGGETWKKLNDGLPEEILGRIGVAVSAARRGRVWAIVEAKEKGGLYRSDDGGEKWTLVSGDHKIRERAWYYSWVYADPKNADGLYLPNVEFHHSTDGGRSFSDIRVSHGDTHDLWIDPENPDRMILGDDGGATITFNGGRTWTTQNNQPTAQFYRVTTDDRFPYWVYGAQQDNATAAVPSGLPEGGQIGVTDWWHDVGGGESGWIAPDPRDPEVVFAGGYGGSITRFDHRSRQVRAIDPWPQLASGRATRDLKFRYQWNAPLLISRHDPKELYFAAQNVMRSTDEGQTWQSVSPDLTRNDRDKQGYAGGPISHDITGVEVYDTIFVLAESPKEPGLMWAGTDDGLVHVTRDHCQTWQNVTPKGMPEWIRINSIETSPHDAATAYVAATMYQFDDDRPYLYKTSDYGKNWTKIVGGIPDDSFTRVVREDPVRRGLLYAGTERGLDLSFDDGEHWRPFPQNLPAAPVTDLAVKEGDLVVATQGRSFWILDDLTPLRQWNAAVESADVHLFPPRPSVRTQIDAPTEEERGPLVEGTNMPGGVVINYWLGKKPEKKDVVKIEILAGGNVIRSFTNEKKIEDEKGDEDASADDGEEHDKEKDKPLEPKAGLNRYVWDMRIFKPTLVPKAVFNEGEHRAPRVAPGSYQVRLTAAGRSVTASFEIRPNPSAGATPEDLKKQYDLLAQIHDGLSVTHETVLKIRDLKAQVKEIAEHAEKIGKGDALKSPAKQLTDKLAAIEKKLWNPDIKADEDDLNYEPRLDHDFAALAGIVSSADARPTTSSEEYSAVLRSELNAVLSDFKMIVDGDLAEFNRAVAAEKIPPVVLLPKAGEAH